MAETLCLLLYSMEEIGQTAHGVRKEVVHMKQAVRLIMGLLSLSLLLLGVGAAQDQYTEGPVSRVTLVHILPGHFNALMDDIKTNIKPIWNPRKAPGSSRATVFS